MRLEGALGAHEFGGVLLANANRACPESLWGATGRHVCSTPVWGQRDPDEMGPRHENINASLGCRFKVWLARRKRIGKFLGEQAVFNQEEAGGATKPAGTGEEVAACLLDLSRGA